MMVNLETILFYHGAQKREHSFQHCVSLPQYQYKLFGIAQQP